MDNWSLRLFRNDLSKLIEIIEREHIAGDFGSLRTVLEALNGKAIIEYELEGICFHINGRMQGTLPENINYYQIYFDNLLKIKHDLVVNSDPLGCYSLDILIDCYANSTTQTKAYCSSWHLDKHNVNDNTKYTHPIYHFQFGGRKMELITDEFSVLSSPRIPHPPMDIFLGFHFIISNFFNSRQYPFVNTIFEDYEYQQIIKRAQKRLWNSYFGAFNSSNVHNDFTFKNVFPLYLN